MDAIDFFLRNLHNIIGHDATARFIGMPSGNKDDCMLCHPELKEKYYPIPKDDK